VKVEQHRKFTFSIFAFDSATGALFRKDRILRIPHQTSLLLAHFLPRVGQLVTREDLRKVLWPEGEFLDHEQGINKAINRLREILHDDPKEPRFLETIPKRGYRFVANVTPSPKEAIDSTIGTPPVDEIVLHPAATSVVSTPEYATEAKPDTSHPMQPIGWEPPKLTTPVQPRHRTARRLPLSLVATAILLVASAGVLLALHARRGTPRGHTVEIGVMPFQAEGLEASQLAESFRINIVDTLSQLPGVQIRSPHAVVEATGAAGVQALARESDLDILLMGTVTQSGDQYLLQLELVRAADANHLASFQYTGSRDELASISKRVQNDFFGYLKTGSEIAQVVNGSTQDQAAYGEYLQGKYDANEETQSQAAAHSAIEHYKAALTRDPHFALAYVGMARAYVAMSNFSESPNQSLDQAKALAAQAVGLNPMLAEAHAELGFASFLRDWDVVLGERELRNAIQLDPHQANYHDQLSVILSDQGRFDESLHEIDLAHAADPSWDGAYETEAYLAGNARQTDRSIRSARNYVNLRPNWPNAHDSLAWMLFAAGQYQQAIAEWRLMAVLEKDWSRVRLEDEGLIAFRRGGIRAYAKVRLAACLAATKGVLHRNDFVLAEWYALAGEKDQAIAAMDTAVTSHDPLSLELAINPMYESLHHDPRYLALLTRIGLTLPFPQDAK
jgi:DNA-binding winged helix-turn-helix (wHTH) protein/tetratricopeptide (TPR) repeat protein